MNKTEGKALQSLGLGPDLIKFFVSYDLPRLRKPKLRKMRQWPHIEVGGDCLRVGKTTAKQVLVEQIGKRKLPFVFSDEDWKSNIYLQDAYSGSKESLLKSQKWFANKKREQLEAVSENSFWIQVVNPEMDFCYAMTNYLVGNLSRKQFGEYEAFYKSLKWEQVPAPDLLVYITAKPKRLIERFRKTAREFEKADELYIRVMRIVNQTWLKQVKGKMAVLVVDTDDFDFSYETGTVKARERLGKMFFEELTGMRWGFVGV